MNNLIVKLVLAIAAATLAACSTYQSVVPDWMRTDRAEAELAAMTPEERAAAPDPIPLDALTDAVVALIRDDGSAGRVVVLRRPG